MDADVGNGNLSQTEKTLAAYQNFSKAINGRDFGIINIEASTLSATSPAASDGSLDDLNLSLYDGERSSINNTFNIPQYSEHDEERLIRFLYTDAEIATQFNQGFYGHTSIGTLVVKGFLNDHPKWKKFLSGIDNDDFVVVIGSIFGGTGASAIPVVLDELKKKKDDIPFYVAALLLTPYFDTAGDANEKKEDALLPDSANFHIKAKTALFYYHDQKQYERTDALYIIGEPETNFSREAYAKGASRQRNKAHPVELFAATSIIDFITAPNKQKNKIITADRDANINGSYYTWNMLRNAGQDLPTDMRQFLKIAILYNKILYGEIKGQTGAGIWQKYYSDLNTRRDDKQNLLYENIHTYFEEFIDWI
jgi:hypothetical protein